MKNFDSTLITDPTRYFDLDKWIKTTDGEDFQELMDMAILAENIPAVVVLSRNGKCNVWRERVLVTAVKTSMENFLFILKNYCDIVWKLSGTVIPYNLFVEASRDNKDSRVRRFVDRLSEFITKNRNDNGDELVLILESDWLNHIEEDGCQTPKLASLTDEEEIFERWNDLLDHACDPVCPVKSSRK